MDGQGLKDFEILAGYMPSQFYIELRSLLFQKPAAGELIKLNSQNGPTFLHEVGHFVQDRATYRGVNDFLESWDRALAVADYVRKSNGEISIPIVDIKTRQSRLNEKYQWALETDLLRYFREPRGEWESEDRYWAYQSHCVEMEEGQLDGRRLRFPTVTVTFIDNHTGQKYNHLLGAWEIKEAYSVAIGYIHGGNAKEFGVSEFQYLAVERILGYFFGDISPKHTIAICHWALQDMAPADRFFQIVEHFNDNDQLPDAESIYDWARNEALNRGFEHKVSDILASVRSYAEKYSKRAKDLGSLFEWYLEHTGTLLNIQLDSHRRFPLDTFLCRPLDWNQEENVQKELINLLLEVELPLIVFPDGALYSLKTTGELSVKSIFLNRASLEVLSSLWIGQEEKWKCPVYNACEHPCKNDDLCLSEPWHQADQVEQCPYGAAAKLIGLSSRHSLSYKPFIEVD